MGASLAYSEEFSLNHLSATRAPSDNVNPSTSPASSRLVALIIARFAPWVQGLAAPRVIRLNRSVYFASCFPVIPLSHKGIS